MAKDLEYTITTLCRNDLLIVGFDASKVTDEQMTALASRMEESYCRDCFYKELRRAANELGIPKIKKE